LTDASAYQGTTAGVVTRVVASVIDGVVILVALVSVYLGVTAVRFLRRPTQFTFPAPNFNLLLVIAGVVVTAYLAWSWTTTGRTLGDQLLGIRVVNQRGARLRPGYALVRAAACVVLPLGLLWVAISKRNKSVQDLLLRSRVIYDWELHARG
jgi:uncharacterized RDD family membrane protein YckC